MGRLPVYLRALVELAESGTPTVSSEELAELTGVNSAKVRKDLSHLGSYGTRGVGYDVAYLVHQIRRELGLTQHWSIVIAGIGNLGHALANYRGFAERGFRPAALVDNDPEKVGEDVGGLRIRPLEDLPVIARDHDALIGVICTPAPAAQYVADAMVRGRRPVDPELRAGRRWSSPRGCRSGRWIWPSSSRSSPTTSNARPRSPRSRVGAGRPRTPEPDP